MGDSRVAATAPPFLLLLGGINPSWPWECARGEKVAAGATQCLGGHRDSVPTEGTAPRLPLSVVTFVPALSHWGGGGGVWCRGGRGCWKCNL